jgi:hypothetical protein
VTLSGNNGLKVDRYGMRGANSTTKREPKAEAMQEISFELGAEFEDVTHVNRVAAAIASDAIATLALHFDSPQGGTLDISMPVARFDEGPVSVDRKITEQSLKGKVLAPADGSQPITLTYVASA